LLEGIGGALVKSAGEFVAEARTVKHILAHPNKALAQEIIETTAELINKPAGLVSEVIATAQQDVKFLEKAREAGTSVGKEFVKLVEEKISKSPNSLSDINKTCEAILKNGYYEVNGFKFSEYYYNRLWEKGRKAPSLVAQAILDNPKIIISDKKPGFFRYEIDGWEMIYNPTTKEVWHVQQIK
jgi:hypothetical protein